MISEAHEAPLNARVLSFIFVRVLLFSPFAPNDTNGRAPSEQAIYRVDGKLWVGNISPIGRKLFIVLQSYHLIPYRQLQQ
jgi:hypothetical protein